MPRKRSLSNGQKKNDLGKRCIMAALLPAYKPALLAATRSLLQARLKPSLLAHLCLNLRQTRALGMLLVTFNTSGFVFIDWLHTAGAAAHVAVLKKATSQSYASTAQAFEAQLRLFRLAVLFNQFSCPHTCQLPVLCGPIWRRWVNLTFITWVKRPG